MNRSEYLLRLMQSFRIRTSDQRMIPFRLNVPQRRVWNQIAPLLDDGKKIWAVLLKARREGISTLIDSLEVAVTISTDYTRSVITAHEEPATKNIMEMADRMIDSSPFRHLSRAVGTTRYFDFRSSKLSISTAGSPDAQRSNDITFWHGSEVAYYPHPEVLTATVQCIPTDHQSFNFLESTANGKSGDGQAFYEVWREASESNSLHGYLPIFLAWFDLPAYELPDSQNPEPWCYADEWGPSMPKDMKVLEDLDEEETELKMRFHLNAGKLAWRRYIGLAVKCKGDLLAFHQEYPSTPEEAFISSGVPFFMPKDLYWLQASLRPGKRYRVYPDGRLERDDQGPIELWVLPEKGHEYVIGADSSMGFDDKTHSRSAIEIMDMATLEQVGEVDSPVAPHVLSAWLAGLGNAYNEALIAPEVQSSGGGGGRSIIDYLTEKYNYFNIHRWKAYDRVVNHAGHLYGWETNTKTRPIMLAKIREVVSEKCCTIHSRELARQLGDFVQNDAGKFCGDAGYDDLIFAWGIALCSREQNYYPMESKLVAQRIDAKEMGLGRVIEPWEWEEQRFQTACRLGKGKVLLKDQVPSYEDF